MMPNDSLTVEGEQPVETENDVPSAGIPLCIRFRHSDRLRVKRAAEAEGLNVTKWISKRIFERARLVLLPSVVAVMLAMDKEAMAGLQQRVADGVDVDDIDTTVPSLTFAKVKAKGKQICIRLRTERFLTIRRAAAQEGTVPATWIRAVVLAALPTEPAREERDTSHDEKNGKASRTKKTKVKGARTSASRAGVKTAKPSPSVRKRDGKAARVRVVGKSKRKTARPARRVRRG